LRHGERSGKRDSRASVTLDPIMLALVPGGTTKYAGNLWFSGALFHPSYVTK
jgi:hypothetical protein